MNVVSPIEIEPAKLATSLNSIGSRHYNLGKWNCQHFVQFLLKELKIYDDVLIPTKYFSEYNCLFTIPSLWNSNFDVKTDIIDYFMYHYVRFSKIG